MPDTKSITIAGHSFEVSTPYVAGHQLTEGEAKALNQVRCENIRNNTANKVKEALENGGDPASIVAEYDQSYEFTLAATGGRQVRDPVEREARSLARSAIKQKLAADGRKLKDIDKDKLAEAIDTVAARDDILKLARDNVKRQSKLAETAGGEIGV